jgi:uncharacterized RDD family membrane protein YckC
MALGDYRQRVSSPSTSAPGSRETGAAGAVPARSQGPTGDAPRTFVVRTPEQVEFGYELAGPVERASAWLLDVGCMSLLMGVLSSGLAAAGAFGAPLMYVGVFLIQWGYFVFFEWRWNGSTPGKRALGLRVVQASGVRCSFERVVLRNFLRVVDALPLLYVLGGALILGTRRGQRLGDMAAGTVCVRVPRAAPPAALGEVRTRFNSLRDDAAARARIRQALSPAEAELVTSLALRRDLMEGPARLLLFERTAAWLRRRLRLVGHDGLPDERLVLNVAAVLLEERVL